jgi:biopolymer transport protein ExbB/TolQ
MEGFSDTSSTVMRDIVAACQTPVVALLLLGILFIVICLGSLIGEFFTEHRKFKVFLPALVDDLKNSPDGPREVIKRSGLLLRQKQCLIELTRHPDITDAMRESLAVGLEYREQKRYDLIVKITDVISRIAPMLGLLGTLIPLGPGILALGTGETQILAQSLLIAFDTTSLGLIIAGFALVISAVRGRWYKEYMVSFDTAIECVLEVEKSNPSPRDYAVDEGGDSEDDGDDGEGEGETGDDGGEDEAGDGADGEDADGEDAGEDGEDS